MQYNKPCFYFDMCHMKDKDAIVRYLASLAPTGDNYMEGVEPWFVVDIDMGGN